MPAGRPRLRAQPLTNANERLRMVTLACQNEPNLRPCDLEARHEGPTRTVETLHALVKSSGSHVIWVMSSDSLRQLPNWYRAEEIDQLASAYVFKRPGFPFPDDQKVFRRVSDASFLRNAPGLIYVSDIKMPSVSSTEIREKIWCDQTVSGLLPDAVHSHIIECGLYRKQR